MLLPALFCSWLLILGPKMLAIGLEIDINICIKIMFVENVAQEYQTISFSQCSGLVTIVSWFYESHIHFAYWRSHQLSRTMMSPHSNRYAQCVGLLDVKPGFVSQVNPFQNEIWKEYFFDNFSFSRFLAKTLRVNKPAMKKFLKKPSFWLDV